MRMTQQQLGTAGTLRIFFSFTHIPLIMLSIWGKHFFKLQFPILNVEGFYLFGHYRMASSARTTVVVDGGGYNPCSDVPVTVRTNTNDIITTTI